MEEELSELVSLMEDLKLLHPDASYEEFERVLEDLDHADL